MNFLAGTGVEPGDAITVLTTIAEGLMTLFTKAPICYFFYAGLAGVAIGIVKKLKG